MRTRDGFDAELIGGRWDARIARRALTSWRASGLTQGEFARMYGFPAQRLSWWRRRLEKKTRRRGVDGAPSLAFIPADVHRSSTVVVQLAGGVLLEIADAAKVAPSWIAALARELERPS
jgi:hypothetical protein